MTLVVIRMYCLGVDRKMSRLKFRIRHLLELAAIVAFAIWWIRWPAQTASTFVADRVAFVSRINATPTSAHAPKVLDSKYFAKPENRLLTTRKRSWADLFLARQSFYYASFRFSVRRGEIVSGPSYYFDYSDMWLR